jgi:peptide/nickel transport system substrate-binding protein
VEKSTAEDPRQRQSFRNRRGPGCPIGAGRYGRFSSRRARALGGAVAAILLLAHCGGAAPSVQRPLRIALASGPLSLDPHASELASLSLLRNLYDALTAFDAGDRVGPSLAQTWENPDELTWIFHLRHGVVFHDGHPFTSRDVLFSIERARQHGGEIATYLVAVDTVTAVGDFEVKITTSRAYPILLNKLAFVLIVPQGAPSAIRRPVGTGPYQLASWVDGKSFTLRAFPSYWGAAPAEPVVDMLLMPVVEARVRHLLSDDVDLIEEPSITNYDRIRSHDGCRVLEQPSLGVTYLALQAGRKPLDDPRVRRAISLAIDRGALVRLALHGVVHPSGQLVPRNVFGFAPDIAVPARDLPTVRSLLASAGYPQGIDLRLQMRPGLQREHDELVSQLAQAGIRVKTIERELAQYGGDADLSFASWYSVSGDASDFFDVMAHSPAQTQGYGMGNFIGSRDPELDRLIEESATTLDLANRGRQLQRAMRVVVGQNVYIPLYSSPLLYGTRTTVDWQPRSDSMILAATIRRRPAAF